MIKLSFISNREILNFAIQDKIIKYTDRKWIKWIQCVPKNKDFETRIKMSRNRLPSFLLTLFDLTEKEQEEYNNAKTDEEISDIIIKDALSKGCKLLNKKNG